MNTFKIRKHQRIQEKISMYERSINDKDLLIENLYNQIQKLKIEQRKDFYNLFELKDSNIKNLMSMRNEELKSIK